jgi:LysM repeat protein
MNVYYPSNFVKKRPTPQRNQWSFIAPEAKTVGARKFTKKNIKRDGVWNKFLDWIDKDNNFQFQILGVGILTLAIILSFQSFVSSTSVDTAAGDVDPINKEVRLLTNFQQASSTSSSSSTGQLQEIPIEMPKVEEPAQTPAVEAEKAKQRNYEVVAGDSVSLIAKKNNVTSQEIIDANKLEDPAAIKVGQVLIIP